MATWRCTFTGVIFGVYSPGMESPLLRIHIYMYIRIYAPRGRSSRRRPTGSVSGRSCSKIEGRRDRKLHPTADQGRPRGFFRGRRRHVEIRNLNSNVHAISSLPFCLISCPSLSRPMKLVHRFDLRRGWRADFRCMSNLYV